jgi:hypothetical protein
MSSLTTTTIDTKDGATNLTVRTGNTSGARIIVTTTDGMAFGNSTANLFVVNAQSHNINSTLNVNNALVVNSSVTVNSALNVSGVSTLSNTLSVTGTVTITGNVSATRLASTNASISSNTLALGIASISGSGYTRLPNGLLYQWGTVSASSSAGDVTFPTSFSTVYSVVGTPNTAVATYQVGVTSVSTTAASFRTANTNSRTVYWMAIGV